MAGSGMRNGKSRPEMTMSLRGTGKVAVPPGEVPGLPRTHPMIHWNKGRERIPATPHSRRTEVMREIRTVRRPEPMAVTLAMTMPPGMAVARPTAGSSTARSTCPIASKSTEGAARISGPDSNGSKSRASSPASACTSPTCAARAIPNMSRASPQSGSIGTNRRRTTTGNPGASGLTWGCSGIAGMPPFYGSILCTAGTRSKSLS